MDGRPASDLLRNELLRLKAGLDEVPFGVVLLDHELRAQFLNRAFRKMFRLPDSKADSKPPFVALLYHGRDIRIYDLPDNELPAYVNNRVAHVKSGDPSPIDIRLSNGEILRFQCTVLPAGGRMLTYTYVTDIVRQSDELKLLHVGLDNVNEGVILLDPQLNAQFMNRAVRQQWNVSDEQAERRPAYAELVNDAKSSKAFDVRPDELDNFVERRIALVRAGDSTPRDLHLSNGRIARSQCSALPGGGRMLTYTDVTDLVQSAEEQMRLATTDVVTNLFNRRHFGSLAESEWSRFQRYHRPLSLILFDIDHFKLINDRFGHATGDMALSWLAEICLQSKRSSDVIARIGGDEFAMLLPETDGDQAGMVADRLRQTIAQRPFAFGDTHIMITVSTGIVEATLSMSGIEAMMRLADKALDQAKSAGRDQVVASAIPAVEYKLAAE